ncbi:MAG: Hint domain-containing protein [Dehalococcoidales bacterium]|nr:Hint domain-containing protein [Dehalococcoidales bacterium]
MFKKLLLLGAILFGLTVVLGTACVKPGGTTPPPPAANYTVTQLKYLLIEEFGEPFFVDTDFYPIAREGIEEQNAVVQFPAIKADAEEFAAILEHLGLPDKTDYTTNETIAIYREHKKLTKGIQMTPSGDVYTFSLRVTEGQGEHIEGTITKSGKITVTKREPSFNTYPICFPKGTQIATPSGQIAVEQLRAGMTVWTADALGQRVAAEVEKTSATPMPETFQVVRLTLSDGRSVTASPGHPSADKRTLGEYKVGDVLDGAIVVSVEKVAYNGGATFDLLPSGPTGTYWANGVLLKSTLLGN